MKHRHVTLPRQGYNDPTHTPLPHAPLPQLPGASGCVPGRTSPASPRQSSSSSHHFPSLGHSPDAREWRLRGRGERKVNEAELPSEATYAQCGRQHFHPTFAVATSAGSMISAWPKEQWPRPERKGRVTNIHQKEQTTPP